jgi:lipopolysaccharide transport system permease protein
VTPLTVIEKSGLPLLSRISEYGHYRALFWFLTLRDIKLRYRETVLGVAWAFLQPLLPALVFTLVLSRVLKPAIGNIPYPLFALIGFSLWSFVSNSLSAATPSFLSHRGMLTRVYFPRAVLPAAAVAACVCDWLVMNFVVLIALMAFGYWPRWSWLLAAGIMLLTLLLAFAAALASASLTARFRDLRHALPFVLQIWMYATPVVYPPSVIPERWRWLLTLNPMTGLVESFRASLLGLDIPVRLLLASVLWTAILLVAGIALFNVLEQDLAETA